MPSVRKLPDDATLLGMADSGMSNKEIAAQYGVTDEAVRLQLSRLGFRRGPARPDHSRYLPWRVRSDHVSDVLARRLRSYSRVQQGRPLSVSEQRLLDEWKQFMDGDNPYGLPLSVHYDRMDDEGFWLEPRQAGDRDYIHPPLETAEEQQA